jgi:hypothetical protein
MAGKLVVAVGEFFAKCLFFCFCELAYASSARWKKDMTGGEMDKSRKTRDVLWMNGE